MPIDRNWTPKEIETGIDVVLTVLRRDYRNDVETLDRVEEELTVYFKEQLF